jgi:hypothetical protein
VIRESDAWVEYHKESREVDIGSRQSLSERTGASRSGTPILGRIHLMLRYDDLRNDTRI